MWEETRLEKLHSFRIPCTLELCVCLCWIYNGKGSQSMTLQRKCKCGKLWHARKLKHLRIAAKHTSTKNNAIAGLVHSSTNTSLA